MSDRRLDIGVASFRNPERLRATLASIEKQSVTDWRCLIFHNPSDNEADEAACGQVLAEAVDRNNRFHVEVLPENVGYAGAVNEILARTDGEYCLYCDNDVEILTHGWDEALCSYLDRFHELAMVVPNGGAYAIQRPGYLEVMWSPGFCWALNKLALEDVGLFDITIGHQQEADYALRIRMAGRKIGAAPEIRVAHNATATNDPAATLRINRGVISFVNKWVKYFCGQHMDYHSPNVLRWHDWPPNALFLETYFRLNGLTGLNDKPETVTINGEKFDLLKVPRLSGFYTSRII